MSGYRIGPHGLLRCQSKSRNRSNKSCRAAPSLTPRASSGNQTAWSAVCLSRSRASCRCHSGWIIPHTRHAQFARRANLSHAFTLAASGKSQRSSRASRLDEEGRFGRSSRYVGRGCDGRERHVGRTWRTRTAKSRGPDLPTLGSSLRAIPQVTVAKKPGHRGGRV